MAPANLPRIRSVFKMAVFGRSSVRGWAAVLVALWLTQVLGNVAWGWTEIDYVNGPRGEGLEGVGRLIEITQKQ